MPSMEATLEIWMKARSGRDSCGTEAKENSVLFTDWNTAWMARPKV